MPDFEQYKKEQDEAEAAYEAELRKKKPHELTPEEIGYLADQNEAFEGKTLDKNAERRYEELAGMVALLLNSDSALQTLAFPPDKSDPNAQISIDFSMAFRMEALEMDTLSAALSLCDVLNIVPYNGGIRMTFTVKNVWRK